MPNLQMIFKGNLEEPKNFFLEVNINSKIYFEEGVTIRQGAQKDRIRYILLKEKEKVKLINMLKKFYLQILLYLSLEK